MNAIQITVTVLASLHLIVLGILLASPGESRTYTYGERWFSFLWSSGLLAWLWHAS